MKNLILLFLFLILLQGCRRYSYLKHFDLPENTAHLPKLKPITDQGIFTDEEYLARSYIHNIARDKDLFLVERQFKKYILDHLSLTRTDKKGYAVLRINHLSVSDDLQYIKFLAVLTMGGSSLIGIPFGRYRTQMDISMEVLDINQKIIGTYNAEAEHTAYVALYYGFSERSARDKSIFEALEQCLSEINKEVMRNFDYLDNTLKTTKELKSIR